MKLPKSTPTIAVLGETGCMRMKHRIHKRQLNYTDELLKISLGRYPLSQLILRKLIKERIDCYFVFLCFILFY